MLNFSFLKAFIFEDNDEKLDYHELKVSLRALGFELKKNDVQKLITDYDIENIGKVSINDFIEICNYFFESFCYLSINVYFLAKNLILERDPKEELKKAFKIFDEENKGDNFIYCDYIF